MDDKESLGRITIPRKTSKNTGVPLVIILCGLPARGKSYLSRKLCTYLHWMGFVVNSFNAGNYRRKFEGSGQQAEYYAKENKQAWNEREMLARLAFDDLVSWLHAGGDVAVFDATNTTIERRRMMLDLCKLNSLPPPMFIESICTDKTLLEKNYRLKLNNDDYKSYDRELALEDFKKRVKLYEQRYEPIGETEIEENLCYLKVFNVGKKIIINNCNGWIKSQVVSILQNFHVTPRRILLTRHGESFDYASGVLGRDCNLTSKGKSFAKRLRDFVEEQSHILPYSDEDYSPDSPPQSDKEGEEGGQLSKTRPFIVFCSALKRSVETIQPICKKYCKIKPDVYPEIDWDSNVSQMSQSSIQTIEEHELNSTLLTSSRSLPISAFKTNPLTTTKIEGEGEEEDEEELTVITTTALNEINAGLFEGFTYETVKEKFPEEYFERKRNKTTYRYPGGESYLDVVQRLQPIVLELERLRKDVLVVCHTAPIRALLAYFLGKHVEELVDKEIPMHTVFEIRPRAYGCDFIEHDLSGKDNGIGLEEEEGKRERLGSR